MTLRHLRIFQAVCLHKTTAAAAVALRISQPSVSSAIREIEDEYHISLFDRMNNRLCITPVGENLRQSAEQFLSQFCQMENELREAETHSLLRLGSSITIAACRLPSIVSTLQNAFPQSSIDVWVGNTNDVLDVGLIESIPTNSNLVGQQFGHDELVFICQCTSPLASRVNVPPQELLSERLILREEGSAARRLVEAALIASLGSLPHIGWESSNNEVILQAVKAGMGIGVLPEALAAPALKNGSIRSFTVEGIHSTRPYYLIRHRNKTQNLLMRAFWQSTIEADNVIE